MFERDRVIINSDQVDSSTFVFDSHDIDSCTAIYSSGQCVNAECVGLSQYVENSTKVINSRSVYDSTNIVDCTNVYGCADLCDCSEMENCNSCRGCRCMENSYFCSNCDNLKHALFCYNLHESNQDYLLFNQPISPMVWQTIQHQLVRNCVTHSLVFTTTEWQPEDYVSSIPQTTRDFRNYYIEYGDEFREWASSLPGATNLILYNIFGDPKFLKGDYTKMNRH